MIYLKNPGKLRLLLSTRQVLTPDAVAGAVRTHGLGLLPAAVNAAYKFLGSRLASLSQVSPDKCGAFLENR